MKKHLSFSHLLRKDKLMMLVSLILAIVIWFLVVYNQGNAEQRVIGNVPVTVALTPYASEDLNLRIVDGADAVATITVEGPRSVIGMLTAKDITVVADTGAILKEGTYTLPLRVSNTGNYKVLSVVGPKGTNNAISVTCDVWSEKPFALTPDNVEMPKLSVTNTEQLRFGTPSLSGTAITDGAVTVSGPKSAIARIARIAAIVSDEAQLSETASFSADLVAYDQYDRPVESISFLNTEDSKVHVVVPVMEYYKESVYLNIKNAPETLYDKVTLSKDHIELWAIPNELEEYMDVVRAGLTVDFDQLLAEKKDINNVITLDETGSVLPFGNSVTLTVAMDLSGYSNKTLSVPISTDNIVVENCPEGYIVKPETNQPLEITLCGPSSVLKKIDPKKVRIVIDGQGLQPVHNQKVPVRVEVDSDSVWAYYGVDGYKIEISIVEE